MKTLQDLFLAELSDMYDAEQRIVTALPKLVQAATCSSLKTALEYHLAQTKGHVTKIEAAFKSIGEKAVAIKCEATAGLLKEADQLASDFKSSTAINAAIIAAAQKVEHYEIASYGCLHAWATVLKHTEAADLMEEILTEEKAANEKLIELAHAKNKEACGSHSAGDAGKFTGSGEVQKPGTKVRMGREVVAENR
jgi:ferritin-like metal-binding protein YciE